MANTGDLFVITLKETHINWGTYRNTNSRDRISGESYIPIPKADAVRIGIYNSNHGEGIGINEYNATSSDGFFTGVLKSTGSNTAGDIYAKNLQTSGNLKELGDWFIEVGVIPGDQIEVKWVSPTQIVLTKV